MPYIYTDEQRQIRDETRRLFSARYSGAALKALLERRGAYDEAFWAAACDMALPGMTVAEADGGLGLGLIDALVVAEECGRVAAGAPFLPAGHAAAWLLAGAGEPAAELLPDIAAGRRKVALAFAEGADILPATPRLRLADGRLHGGKTAVTGGATADVALVLAQADGAPVVAVADLADGHVRRDAVETIDNSRGLADLAFDAAPARVVPLGDAATKAAGALDRLALLLAAEGVGGADACMEAARDYALQRQAFGQPIGKFQAVKHAIAEMYVLNEMARASVLDAAVRLERGDADASAFVGAARLNAVQAYESAAAGATQIHGGLGVTWDCDLHLHYRRARALAVEGGASIFWEDRIVAVLEAA